METPRREALKHATKLADCSALEVVGTKVSKGNACVCLKCKAEIPTTPGKDKERQSGCKKSVRTLGNNESSVKDEG